MTDCPSCGAKAAPDAAECAACGLVFAKWKERKERERKEAAEGLARLETSPPAPGAERQWKIRAAALAFVVFWIAALAVYMQIAINRTVEKTLESR